MQLKMLETIVAAENESKSTIIEKALAKFDQVVTIGDGTNNATSHTQIWIYSNSNATPQISFSTPCAYQNLTDVAGPRADFEAFLNQVLPQDCTDKIIVITNETIIEL